MKVKITKTKQDKLIERLKKELPNNTFKFVNSGGIGYVFETQYQGEKVKVKIFEDPYTFRNDFKELPFKKENIEIEKIQHPNLMKVHKNSPSGILICEDCGDISLFQRINYKTEKSLERNLLAYWSLLEAEEYLLKNNLTHLDLKPDQIIFHKYQNNPKIIDYDTMRKLEPKRDYLTSFFTVIEASPEMISFGPISEKTDIFNLGNILYAITQKKIPFEKELDEEKGKPLFVIFERYEQLLKTTPEYKKISISGIDNDKIEELIQKMRLNNVDKRIDIYESMTMFKDALSKSLKKNLE